MKLGVGFNVFNGAELLKPSILCVRPLASLVVVVYSLKAITGEDAPKWLLPLLLKLKSEGLVDDLIKVKHSTTSVPLTIQNEKRKKYEVARKYCFDRGCSHYMGRDCDEFFVTKHLKRALETYVGEEMVVCPLFDYVREPTFRAKNVSSLHVTAFQKASIPYSPKRCGVKLDMSRTVAASNVRILKQEELVMHHMTGVRYNSEEMDRKFQGHSHFGVYGEGKREVYLNNIQSAGLDVFENVPDRFEVLSYWKNEFRFIHDL